MDVLRPQHPHKFTGGQHEIHIATGPGFHGGQRAFRLFGHAGHDGHAEDFGRVHPDLFGEVVLCHRAKHLLRALGGRKPADHIRVMPLQVAHPARAAGGEHRLVLGFAGAEAVQELGSLLHDRQIGREGGIKHIVKAKGPQRGGHAVDRRLFRRQAQAFAPGRPHRRRNLHHGDDIGIFNRGKRLFGVVALAQRTGRAMGDALAAEHAVAFLDASVVAYINPGAAAGAGQVPNVHVLHLVTNLDAAHALDALVGIAVEREVPRPKRPHPGDQVARVRGIQNSQVVGNVLQVAVAAALAGSAVAVVLAENQLDVDLAGTAHPRGVGADHHPLKHRVVAAGHQIAFAFNLNAADPAGADFVEFFQVAQVGDVHPGGAGGLKDGCALRHADGLAVDCHIYHWVVLPPLKMP